HSDRWGIRGYAVICVLYLQHIQGQELGAHSVLGIFHPWCAVVHSSRSWCTSSFARGANNWWYSSRRDVGGNGAIVYIAWQFMVSAQARLVLTIRSTGRSPAARVRAGYLKR